MGGAAGGGGGMAIDIRLGIGDVLSTQEALRSCTALRAGHRREGCQGVCARQRYGCTPRVQGVGGCEGQLQSARDAQGLRSSLPARVLQGLGSCGAGHVAGLGACGGALCSRKGRGSRAGDAEILGAHTVAERFGCRDSRTPEVHAVPL